jgi:hypothetical protein
MRRIVSLILLNNSLFAHLGNWLRIAAQSLAFCAPDQREIAKFPVFFPASGNLT